MRFANQDGFSELNNFPGCNQIVVSNHAFIYPSKRGQGKGQEQHSTRLFRARELGYNYIICTVNQANDVERHILLKNRWSLLDSFLNEETGHVVEIWGRILRIAEPVLSTCTTASSS